MKKITTITGDPNQQMLIALDDGSQIKLTLNFFASQMGWFYSITYGNFVVSNRRMVSSPNMLRAFRNVIPFGLACTIDDGGEPILVTDFKYGRASLFVITQAELADVETFIRA